MTMCDRFSYSLKCNIELQDDMPNVRTLLHECTGAPNFIIQGKIIKLATFKSVAVPFLNIVELFMSEVTMRPVKDSVKDIDVDNVILKDKTFSFVA